MAGALVGGAFLSATIQVLFDQMASPSVLGFFKGQKFSAQPLKKLKTKMITINKVLDDAEDKQHTDPCVKQWLDELKDVVYEAEDVLDEIASEVQRSKIEDESKTTLEKVQDFASSHNPFKTGKNEKLEEILGTLEDLVEQKHALGLIDRTGGKLLYQRTPTTSIPDESVIYGRDDDKEDIMKWLLSNDLNSINPGVLAIVGLGGLGKTTLAQHVYSDSRVPDCFDKKAWVCVSEEFNVSKVTKDILQGFTKQSFYTNNLDQLQSGLHDDLTGKKFLLVLDDVWNKDYLKWKNLLKPLMSGKEGSKILVTSRNLDVADCIKTSPTHQLQKLSDDDCWLLFEKHAFVGTEVSGAHPAFERIGRQMVEKCDGLPLAAKLLGGALWSERNPEKWIKALESDMLDVHKDSILPILKLSYQYLPCHLKRCFAYCAVFPKDYEFVKEKLIRLWMAEGLLTQPKVRVDIEQVGEDCFDDLVSRSFFQQSTGRKYFLMHDLINDLAKSISGEFCFRYGVDRSWEISERIRHLWLGHKQVHEVDNRIFTIQHLRTILLRDWSEQKEVKNWLWTFARLRVLSLRCNKLPNSIGNLMHLRYLNLCHSSIQRLPDSVATLCNLETLLLRDCNRLVELPATIFKLINLSQLDIRGTKLGKMPPHVGKLKKLGELAYYIVGKESDCSIKELGPLQRLQGHLSIKKLRNVSQVQESEEASLKCKEKLKRLELMWNDEGSEDSLHERNVLEQLQPHTNVEQLAINGYAGTRFPDWVGDSSFSNMVELELNGCRYCSFLPPLGQLGSLKRLSIIEFNGITVVGKEFYGNSNKPPFGCPESLRFEGMRQWQEWVPYWNMEEGDGATAAFPLLQVLEIVECPKLNKTLPADLPSLKTLEIRVCRLLKSFPLDLSPVLEKLEISDCGNLEFLSAAAAAEFEPLKILIIEYCPNLKEIRPTYLPFLTELRIIGCDSLKCFPPDSAPPSENLEIYDCRNLECPFAAAAGGAELEHLKSLWIQYCPNLKEIRLTHLPSLTELRIINCDSLKNFPLDLAPALEIFEISDCGNLELLSAGAEAELERLKYLTFKDCPNLKEIQPTHLPSLIKLRIRGCDQLVSLPRAPAPQKLKIVAYSSDVQIPKACFPKLVFSHWDFSRTLDLGYRNSSHLSLGKVVRLMAPNYIPSELKRLLVGGWDSVTSFPLDFFPMLESIKIYNCAKLQSLSAASQAQPLQRCESLELRECPNLKRLSECMVASLFPSLMELHIYNCPESIVVDLLRISPNLTRLCLRSCFEELESFPPENMLMPSTLTSLTISGHENLESLDHWGLHRLNSLTQLYIYDCPKLKSIPKERLPSSLQCVEISNCTLLKLDKDWPFNPPLSWLLPVSILSLYIFYSLSSCHFTKHCYGQDLTPSVGFSLRLHHSDNERY